MYKYTIICEVQPRTYAPKWRFTANIMRYARVMSYDSKVYIRALAYKYKRIPTVQARMYAPNSLKTNKLIKGMRAIWAMTDMYTRFGIYI